MRRRLRIRDPRINPRPGDILALPGMPFSRREVIRLENHLIGAFDEEIFDVVFRDHRGERQCWCTQWRRWAKDADVLRKNIKPLQKTPAKRKK